MKQLLVGLVAVATLMLAACDQSVTTAESAQEVINDSDSDKVAPKVIYGQDDRLDLHEVGQQIWQTKASSTVALFKSSDVSRLASGRYRLATRHFGQSRNLCPTEPFYNQQAGAFCSGSLIAPDVVMTAGHCVRKAQPCTDPNNPFCRPVPENCSTTRFVFGFAYERANSVVNSVGANDVYSCAEVIVSQVDNASGSDYALIRLDRPVVGHNPIPIRQSGEVNQGDPLVVIGHPSGLPTKIAGGAVVRDNNPQTHFVTNLDTYGGNSGSAVFNADTGVVEGILVRGARDYIFQNGCMVSNVCSVQDESNPTCGGEDVTRVSEVLSHIDIRELVAASPPIREEEEPIEEPADEPVDEPQRLVAVSEVLQMPIPDRSAFGIKHRLPAVEINQDTNVIVDIQHTWIGDLSVVVQSPDGDRKILHDRTGASRNNLFDMYNWNSLPVVSRGVADGVWTIEVKDMAFIDTGHLVRWAVDSRP